jgi:hypothetical protein
MPVSMYRGNRLAVAAMTLVNGKNCVSVWQLCRWIAGLARWIDVLAN